MADTLRQVLRQHLERDGASVAEISREINHRHSTTAYLTLDRVMRRQRVVQMVLDSRHPCKDAGLPELARGGTEPDLQPASLSALRDLTKAPGSETRLNFNGDKSAFPMHLLPMHRHLRAWPSSSQDCN